MSMLKSFVKDKQKTLMENSDYSKLTFQYVESDTIQDNLKIYAKERNIDPNIITEQLEESCVTFEALDYSDKNGSSLHEDLIDSGYVLGYVHAKTPGKIFGVVFDKVRYYYIGNESDILKVIKDRLNKYLKV